MNRFLRRPALLSTLQTAAIAVIAWGMGPALSVAETIQVPVGQQGQDKMNVARPRAGMDQHQVREKFGNPIDWTNPVGDPPISKWTYRDFIVFFEYDHVIHSVLVHAAQPGSQSQGDQSEALNVLSQTTN